MNNDAKNEAKTDVKKQAFGKTPEGADVELYTLTNTNGMQAKIITYGGTVVSLTAPDRNGKYADVVLGLDDLAAYTKGTAFFGALIGRYGNRIGHAQFTLDGKTYKLPANDNGNTLHGGPEGFDKRVWTAVPGSGRRRPDARADLRQQGWRGRLSRATSPPKWSTPSPRRTSSRSITPPPPTSPPSSTLPTIRTSTSPDRAKATSWATKS